MAGRQLKFQICGTVITLIVKSAHYIPWKCVILIVEWFVNVTQDCNLNLRHSILSVELICLVCYKEEKTVEMETKRHLFVIFLVILGVCAFGKFIPIKWQFTLLIGIHADYFNYIIDYNFWKYAQPCYRLSDICILYWL